MRRRHFIALLGGVATGHARLFFAAAPWPPNQLARYNPANGTCAAH